MSQIKTVTTVSSENEVTFDAFYSFVWFKNVGDTDVYVAPYSGFSAGDVDVSACPAGQMVRITARNEKVYILGATTLEIHAQNFSDCPFKVRGKGGEQITVTPLSVSENGVYTAPTGSAYSPVTVDVVEQPWEPLQDGYSNFWFELTDDTLSPWLNFSAKNADAVIDWGDGSGEVALDTLAPTHTYSKAGKYVVKVKGVTGIARQHSAPYNGAYLDILTNIELNEEVTSLANLTFYGCVNLKNAVLTDNITSIGSGAFQYCTRMNIPALPSGITTILASTFSINVVTTSVTAPEGITSIGATAFYGNFGLQRVILPSTLSWLGNQAFQSCASLAEVHIAATVPPELGSNVFSGLPNAWICYVPVGTGDTYKSASGWSTYADHIVEEGQSLSKAALRRIQAAEKTDESEVR